MTMKPGAYHSHKDLPCVCYPEWKQTVSHSGQNQLGRSDIPAVESKYTHAKEIGRLT